MVLMIVVLGFVLKLHLGLLGAAVMVMIVVVGPVLTLYLRLMVAVVIMVLWRLAFVEGNGRGYGAYLHGEVY